MTQCQKQNCLNESPKPPYHKCHLCGECYDSFQKDKDQTSIPLKDGRAMSKGPEEEGRNGRRFAPLQILAYHVQPSVVSQDFTHDFSAHQSIDVLNMDIGQQQNEIPIPPSPFESSASIKEKGPRYNQTICDGRFHHTVRRPLRHHKRLQDDEICLIEWIWENRLQIYEENSKIDTKPGNHAMH